MIIKNDDPVMARLKTFILNPTWFYFLLIGM